MKVLEQCGIAASKGNQIIGLIRINKTYKVKQLYFSIEQYFRICIHALRPYRKKDRERERERERDRDRER